MSEGRASLLELGLGLVLFLPIPLVLYLFVVHPPPLGVSLVTGLALMVAHRFVARPYMRRVAAKRSLWTGLPARAADGCVEIRLGKKALSAAARPSERVDLLRFFAFVRRWRWAIRLGIFVPLLLLLICLGLAAAGRATPLGSVTAFFQLAVGLTVVATSLLWRLERSPLEPIVPAVPMHTFFLLGTVPLLWIFRIVGVWWIWTGFSYLISW